MTTLDALDEVLRSAVEVRVTDNFDGEEVVRTRDREVLRTLREALAVGSFTDFVCMCHGEFRLGFSDAGGRSIAHVALHDGTSLDWQGWGGQATLADRTLIERWLAAQGADGPARRQRAAEESRRALDDWRAAAPPALHGTHGSLAERLTAAYPDPVERAAVVLAWHGSGTGRCTDFPAHEATPEPILAAMPVAHLIRALQAHPGDARMHSGAVRHLCGFKTRPNQTRDIGKLPREVRQRLLASARASGDEDKRDRAERMLGARR
ncbi:hypothetical protein [Winogradskya humida]|uniref:hypothetical protein n=1 Tax=Winogradskya humida TaxID=113566 RepID=UPI0019414989|nr:hypothetical protein [Actinoplanes humidus]